jgi:toxin-antitoxin system PIN domain toxin
MSIALLDVNVLIALFDPAHPNHEDAHLWFGRHRKRGWATCPLTINGCIRILSNPAYPTVEATPYDVASRLRTLCDDPGHHFWSDSLSLLDEKVFHVRFIGGHRKITDAYLLGLAVHCGGKLVTFDRSIPAKAIIGAGPNHFEVIGPPSNKPRHPNGCLK